MYHVFVIFIFHNLKVAPKAVAPKPASKTRRVVKDAEPAAPKKEEKKAEVS